MTDRLKVEAVADDLIAADTADAAAAAAGRGDRWGKPDEPEPRITISYGEPVEALDRPVVMPPPKPEPKPEPKRKKRPSNRLFWLVMTGGVVVLSIVGATAFGFFTPDTSTGSRPPGTPATGGPGATPTPTPTAAVAVSPKCNAAAAVYQAVGVVPPDAICDVQLADGRGDQVEYAGTPLAEQPPTGDIVGVALFETTLGPAQIKTVLERCGAEGIRCAGDPPPGGYLAFVILFANTTGQELARFWEAGIGFFDQQPVGGEPAVTWNGAPADVLTGHNVVYTLRFPSPPDPIAGPFRLFFDGSRQSGLPAFFRELPTDMFVTFESDALVGFIASDELAVPVSYRFFSYSAASDGTGSGVDEAPDFDLPALTLQAPLPHLPLD